MSTRRPAVEYSRSPSDRRQNRTDEFTSLYKIGHQLGIGADSIVYECRNISTSEKCAVKVTDITKANLKMLQEESDMLCQLNFPNVVKGYGIHITSDKVYIVIELVEGEELHSIIRQSGGLPEEDAIPLVFQLIQAVIYLHDNKICHRDIKPENILISDEGKVKLIDFGLAARLDGDGTMHARVGTQAYQAPEVLIGLPYTQVIDMWAVGATVYTLLSGTKPFGYGPHQRDSPSEDGEGPTPDQKAHQRAKILNGDFNFSDNVWEKISENAKNFVSRLLKVRPADRMSPQDAMNHPWLSSEEIDFRSWHFKWRSNSRDRREACRREQREKGRQNAHLDSHTATEEETESSRGQDSLSLSRKIKSQSVMYSSKYAITVPVINPSGRQINSHRTTYGSEGSALTDRHTERSVRTDRSNYSDHHSIRYTQRSERTEQRSTERHTERTYGYERPERSERIRVTDYTPTRLAPPQTRSVLTQSRSGVTVSSLGSYSARRKF